MSLRKATLVLLLMLCSPALWAQEPLGMIPPEDSPAAGPMAPAPSGLIDMPALTPGVNAEDDVPYDVEDRLGHVNLEYLLWWIQSPKVPVLVSGGDVLDAVPGAFGQEGTFPLLDKIGMPPTLGGRLTMYRWLNENQVAGVEGVFWGARSFSRETFTSRGTGTEPVLARPFFNVNSGTLDADPVGLPFAMAGTVQISLPSTMVSGEVNFHLAPSGGSEWQFRYFGGPRYLQLDEKLIINHASVELVDGQLDFVHDQFGTTNRYYGGQAGVGFEYRGGRLLLDVRTKLGFGRTEQTVRTDGGTALTTATGETTVLGDRGLLVQPFNAGLEVKRKAWSVVPEFSINGGLQLNEYFSIYLGYNFLYWSNVVRPGDALSQNISLQPCCPGVILGAHEPSLNPTQSSVWIQGLTLGLEINF